MHLSIWAWSKLLTLKSLLLTLTLNLKSKTKKNKKIKNSTTNVMTSSFQWSIFQHHQRMDFTFHTTFVILKFAPSTVFFLQSSVNDANPTQKGYISPDKIIYKNHTVVIWLTVTKYPYTFFRRFVLSSIIAKILAYWTVYMSNTVGVW